MFCDHSWMQLWSPHAASRMGWSCLRPRAMKPTGIVSRYWSKSLNICVHPYPSAVKITLLFHEWTFAPTKCTLYPSVQMEVIMTELSTKRARSELSALLKRVEKGEEVTISRRGKQIARIVPMQGASKRLPSLKKFRQEIRLHGEPMSRTVVKNRQEERY